MLKSSLCFAIFVSICAGVYVAKGNCPTNEEYALCGSACPANCSEPNPGNCSNTCVEGCFCMPGYLRIENGTCVNAGQCVTNTDCGENEEYLSCGTACPSTCSVPEPELCILSCKMGCFCKEGYYRDETTGKCVTLNNCSNSTDMCFNTNEVFDICNATCQPSCSTPEPICVKICKSGCICTPGLLRNPEGECVSVDKCPPGNGTQPTVLTKYLNAINKILHMTTV